MATEYGSMSPTPDLEPQFDDQPASVRVTPKWLSLLERFRILTGFDECHSDKKMLQAPEECISLKPRLVEGIDYVGLLDVHAKCKNDSRLGSGGGAGSDGHTIIAMGALTNASFKQIRFLLMSAAVYFATLGFTNTIIAHDVRGDSNGTYSFITDLARGNHMFFQMFTLVNILGFATSSGALLIRVDKEKLKSGLMFRPCSIIAFLCMALSFSVLVVVCVSVSLGALTATGSNG